MDNPIETKILKAIDRALAVEDYDLPNYTLEQITTILVMEDKSFASVPTDTMHYHIMTWRILTFSKSLNKERM